MKLTVKQAKFAEEFVKSSNATDAYRRAYNCSKMKESTINTSAWQLKNDPQVAERIEQLLTLAAKEAVFTAADLIKLWSDIATADPNELTQHRRICCRHCHGDGHHYQWKDEKDYAFALARVMDSNAALVKKNLEPAPLPDTLGGFGFRFNARPHPECPECLGEGREDVWFVDTDTLQGKARRLYAGVKKTKDGLQILMRDQDGAAANLGKAFGLFKQEVNVTGAGGGPVAIVDIKLPSDPIEAARMYQALMKAK